MPVEEPTRRRPRSPRGDRPGRGPAAIVSILLLALLAASPGEAARKTGHGTVSGTVTSKVSGEPLEDVEITLTAADGTRESTTTDRRGRFSIQVPAGEYRIGLAREGYAPFEAALPVEAGAAQVVSVELLDAAAGRRGEAAAAYNAGADALRAGDRAAAKKSFLAAVEADPTLPEPHLVLAGIYLEEEAWSEAAAAAETFLAARPGDARALRSAYEAHRRLGDAARVVELRGALAADPELAPQLARHAFNEGAEAIQAGDPETARARFAEALELDAGLAAAHFGLATLEYEAERYAEALAAADRGLAIEPGSAQGRRLVFVIQEARGDAAATAAAIAAYAEVDPAAVAEIFFKRGEAEFLAGDYSAAAAVLETVLEHQPEHAHAHRVLGLALVSSDAERAATHLRRFLELAPGDPEAATVEEILASL